MDLGKLQEVYDKLGTTVGKKISYVDILPVEVKSGKTGTLRSLHLLMELKHLPLALRFSTNTPVMETVTSSIPQSHYKYTLITLPLYLVGQTRRLIRSL
jgi:uncharacterized protein